MIARRLREIGVYSELFPFDVDLAELKEFHPGGIILSGGPFSVYDKEAPIRDLQPLIDMAPVLGICYGMQLLVKELGGVVEAAENREYGLNKVLWSQALHDDVPKEQKVWMSHGDVVKQIPEDFELLAVSQGGHPAAIRSKRVWAVQFHPEVSHTDHGLEILKAFALDLCQLKSSWNQKFIANYLLEEIQNKVAPNEHVLCALSGGVDSTVVATLLTKALGPERVHCVFVNNGLLRKNEFEEVKGIYQELKLNLHTVDAEARFLEKLKDIEDPEEKRKRIGRLFIEIFEEECHLHKDITYLGQGTLYPDVIESVSLRGSSVTIKSHHNVGGLPEKMNLKLIEPLRELFKDEVREIGEELGIPREILWRHPFPGPGLAVRVLGAITKEDLDTLREADHIFIRELKESGHYRKIWQAFAALLPVRSVGVQGDGRTYGKTIVLRAITSKDGMTADWYEFPSDFLRHVSNAITNEVKNINRVVYDVTSKPPATIEWE